MAALPCICGKQVKSRKVRGYQNKVWICPGYFLQFVNTKAWLMAIAGAAAFMPQFSSIHLNVFVFAAYLLPYGIPCMITWIYFR